MRWWNICARSHTIVVKLISRSMDLLLVHIAAKKKKKKSATSRELFHAFKITKKSSFMCQKLTTDFAANWTDEITLQNSSSLSKKPYSSFSLRSSAPEFCSAWTKAGIYQVGLEFAAECAVCFIYFHWCHLQLFRYSDHYIKKWIHVPREEKKLYLCINPNIYITVLERFESGTFHFSGLFWVCFSVICFICYSLLFC